MKNGYTAILLAAGCSQRLAELTKDVPKSFLKLGNKRIIEYNLDHIKENQIEEIILVVGYKKEKFQEAFGDNYKGIAIKYVISEDYINTDNGYSLYLTKEKWVNNKRDVLIIDADMYFQKGILKKVIDCEDKNVTLVEEKHKEKDSVEEMVLGSGGIVDGFMRTAGRGISNVAGEQAGITKLSSEFIEDYYNYCKQYFDEYGYNQKYERVFDHVLRKWKLKMNYLEVNGFTWININKIEDYESAKKTSQLRIMFFIKN